jgi:hypothetical protein
MAGGNPPLTGTHSSGPVALDWSNKEVYNNLRSILSSLEVEEPAPPPLPGKKKKSATDIATSGATSSFTATKATTAAAPAPTTAGTGAAATRKKAPVPAAIAGARDDAAVAAPSLPPKQQASKKAAAAAVSAARQGVTGARMRHDMLTSSSQSSASTSDETSEAHSAPVRAPKPIVAPADDQMLGKLTKETRTKSRRAFDDTFGTFDVPASMRTMPAHGVESASAATGGSNTLLALSLDDATVLSVSAVDVRLPRTDSVCARRRIAPCRPRVRWRQRCPPNDATASAQRRRASYLPDLSHLMFVLW